MSATIDAPARTFGSLSWEPADDAFGGHPQFVIEAEPNVMLRLKRILPRVKAWRQGFVTVKDTPEVARDLEWVLSRWPMEMDAAAREHLSERADEHRDAEVAVARILQGRAEPLPFQQPAIPLYWWQQQAADIALTTRRLLLGDDLGLGKTISGAAVFCDPDVLPGLVVCPPHLVRQWNRELGRFFPWLRTHAIKTTKVYDPGKTRALRGHQPDVLITTYSKLHGWADHLAGEVRSVVFDEVQELRHTDTQKYTAAARIADAAELRVGMSATPVFNYGGEIHNIISILDDDLLGSREEFVREWGAGGRDRGTKTRVTDPQALGHYLRETGIFLRRVDKDVGRDKLDAERIPHLIDHDDKQLRDGIASAYDVAQRIVAKSTAPLERGQAAREIDWRVRQATGIAKAPYVAAFCKLLLETEDRIVVWAWHRAVWDALGMALAEYNPVLYTGSESPAAKDRAVQAFLEPLERTPYEGAEPLPNHDASRVFLMSLRSGSGVDGLQKVCRTGVIAELDWSPAVVDQCIGRLDRPGQEHRVRAYFLHTDEGSDPALMDVLSDKRMQAEPIRDPDQPLFEMKGADVDRARVLAETVLAQQRRSGR